MYILKQSKMGDYSMKPSINAILIVLIYFVCSYAQTIISAGPVSGTWTVAGSPYQIMGDIEVQSGNTLIIEPGVTIEFHGDYRFIINGTLNANGQESDSIIIGIGGGATEFFGIRFMTGSSGSMNYCRIENGNKNGTTSPDDTYGGAILISGTNNVTISNCVIRNNNAEIGGGGIALYNSNAIITNCRIYNNTVNRSVPSSAYGGGLYVRGSGTIENNEIFNNQCNSSGSGNASGGGINFVSGSPVFRNNVVYNNSSKRGGGVSIFANSTVIMVNNVIYGNNANAGDGGGVFIQDQNVNVSIYNVIFGNNSATGNGANLFLENSNGALCTIDYCDIIGGNATLSETTPGGLTIGANNLNADPLFADATNNKYYLLPGSPCIDAGTSLNAPASDFTGNPTNQDGNNDGTPAYDIGVFEFLSDAAVFSSSQLTNTFQVNTFEASPSTIADISINNYTSGSGTISVACFTKQFPLNAPTGSKAIHRWYRISETGNLVYSDATLTLYYSDVELAASNLSETNLTLWKYENGNWVNKGGVVNTTNNSVTVAGINPAGDWAFADMNDHSLPVDLISLNGFYENGTIKLKWVTENEIDILGFEIFRRSQGSDGYIYIGGYQTHPSLKSNGNSNTRVEYEFEDRTVNDGETYEYLLLEVGLDYTKNELGSITILASENQSISEYQITGNYPNPFNPITYFKIKSSSKVQLHFYVYDMLGRLIYRSNELLPGSGTHIISWYPEGVSSGTYLYLIEVIDANSKKLVQRYSGKMILLK